MNTTTTISIQIPSLESFTPILGTKASDAIHSNAINIIGFCYDGSTSFRPGARFAPNAIRVASVGMETYSPYADLDMEDYAIFDLGNLPFHPSRRELSANIFDEAVKHLNIRETKAKFLTLGGEHSISFTPISLYLRDYHDLLLIHLDAHTDLRDGYLGDEHSHAAVIKRVHERMQPTQSLLQYGIRSGMKEEFLFMKKHNTLCASLNNLLDKIENTPATRPIYLTLDLDFFDPAYCPGTGTPEPGGENFHSFLKIIKALQAKNLVGADVVELAPNIDPTANSNSFAAIIVREILLAMV
ncbi:MAG: agmatinase [Oligoflexia bacterium]|nr:agmatinase [Oligoflexia bacterium]MBF0365953.1 agmatinase [Oligoflexia bacterium]